MNEEVLISIKTEEEGDGFAKLSQLKSTLIGITQEQKQLQDAFKKGNITQKEYADEVVRLEANQKKLRSEYSETQKSITGLKSPMDKLNENLEKNSGLIDKLIPGFSNVTGEVSKTISSVKSLTLAEVALLAPLALVAAALGLLTVFFTRTEEGGDSFAKKLDQIKAVAGVFLDRLGALGGALAKLFTGDFTGAAESARKAVSGVADEMAREYEIAGKLAEIIDELGNRESDYKIAASESTLEIKRLIMESKNRLLTEQQRIDKLKEAHQLELKQNAELKAIRMDQIRVAVQQLELNNSQLDLQREKDESELEYAIRLAATREVKMADIDALAETIIAYNEAEGASLVIQEKINNQIDLNIEKIEAEKQKREELTNAAKKWVDDILAKERQRSQEEIQLSQEAISNTAQANLEKVNITKDAADSMFAAAKKLQGDIQQLEKEGAQNYNELLQGRMMAFIEAHKAEIQAIMATVDVVSDVSSKIATIKNMQYQNELDAVTLKERAELEALKEKYNQGLISKEEYDKERTALEKKFDAEERHIKLKAFETNKKNQIVQAIADTIQSGVRAFLSLVGIPVVGHVLAPAAAAAALAFGYKQVDEIKKQQFVGAEGGEVPGRWKTIGGKYHSSGGTKFWMSDGTRGELERDEGMFILKRSAHADFLREQSLRNQRYGGRSWLDGTPANASLPSYALGGSVSLQRSGAGGVTTGQLQQALAPLIDRINSVQQVLVVGDVTEAQSTISLVESKADLL